MKILLLSITLTCMMINSGCTYTNKIKVDQNLNDKPYIVTDKKPVKVAINKSYFENATAIASPGLVTLTVYYDDYFADILKYKLSKYYDANIVSNENNANYDYLLNVKMTTGGMCGGMSCYLQTLTSVDLKSTRDNKTYILANNFADHYVWSEPTSAKLLGVISGLTMCVICPITGPIGVNIEGDELYSQVKMSTDRITDRIVDMLNTTDILKVYN